MSKLIVIGGGISGLTVGIYGAASGYEVEVYEKNNVAGGECTGWDRRGFHIDNCIHWLMGASKGTALNDIWRFTHALRDDIEIIQASSMYTSEYEGERVTLWRDIARTEAELMALSPDDAAEIKALMESCRMGMSVQIPAEKPPELMVPLDLMKMGKSMKGALGLFKRYAGMDTKDLMNRFKHPLIQRLISDFCPSDTAGSSFPMAYGNFVSGDGGVPRGGSRAMALRMCERFESLGGRLFTGAPAAKIELDGKKAVGVRLKSGELISGDWIICACDPDFTFNALLDPSYMDNVLSTVYANRADYPVYGMFQAAFAVDSAHDAMGGDIMLECSDIADEEWFSNRMSVKTYAYEPDFAPEGKQLIQVLWGLDESAYEYWASLYADKDAYNARKRELADRVMKKLEARFPEYEGKLSILDVWTPMTYKRWCNAYKGYNQAYVITKRSMKNAYVAPWIKGLDNVLLAGQWLAAPGGLPGAAIQGKYAIQRILKKQGRKLNI